MSTRKVFPFLIGLFWLASMTGSAIAASLADYARTAINEAYFTEPRRPGIAVAFAGVTPPGDRIAVSFALTPFVWVTGRPNRITHVAEADLVIVHLKTLKQLPGAGEIDPRIAAVVQKNAAQLQQGGACTKIIETGAGGARRSYVFLSLDDNEQLRQSCLYGHVRALFGLREEGEIGEFADTFLADLTIARCISQMALPQPHPAPGEAKAAIVKALAAGTCGRGNR